METCERLAPGTYTYCKHTLLLDGIVREVFVGKWVQDPDHEGRHLYKFPTGVSVPGGTTMCIVNLKRPVTIDEFRSIRREGIHPVVSSTDDNTTVSAILVTASLAETLPNGM